MMNAGLKKVVFALALAGSLAACAGCQKKDPTAQALGAVEHELATVHPGGAGVASPAVRTKIYTQAVSSLKTASRDSSGAQRDAASVLLAESYSGLSRLSAEKAGEIERRLLDSADRLRAQLDLFIAQSSLADALAAVDPTKEFAQLDQALSDVDVSMSDAQAARRSRQTQVEQLASQAEAKTRQADAQRVRAGQLRSKSLEAPPEQVAALAQQAYEIQRQSAQAEVEASRLTARAQKITPRIAEQKRLIESLGEERTHLTEARQRVDARVKIARQQSQAARAEALAAEKEVTHILDQIEALVAGNLAEQWRQAITAAQNALAAMNQARGMDRTTGAIARGQIQQRLGELHAAVARGLERYRLVLRAVQGAGDASTIAGKAEQIETRIESQIDQARQDSRDAFEQAAASFSGASVRDASTRDRLERIQKLLADLAQQNTAEISDDASES